jgi:hypothetical protein
MQAGCFGGFIATEPLYGKKCGRDAAKTAAATAVGVETMHEKTSSLPVGKMTRRRAMTARRMTL